MIRNFRHKGLKLLYDTGSGRLLAPTVVPKLEDLLSVLDVATSLDDLHLPGLHPLKGRRRGERAVTITANWRLVFRLCDGHVCDVDYEDYH
ncbi:MAG TPA: type II toxin-antitoxin system RelE/ParE family toxin [Gemmatimonadaceae bacterium]|nr:type II toxin-antitoxin system RelE/ParE family toxin [Gemmatimonadaceae bacterium]